MATTLPPSSALADRVDELLARYRDHGASVAHLLCDGHPADALAYRVVSPDLAVRTVTYGELRESSERFAAALAGLGVGPGDRVATLLGKGVEQLVTVLAVWRLGAVHVPLFTAFAPAALAPRLTGSAAKVVVCDPDQRAKLRPGADLPADQPWRTVVTGEPVDVGDLSFASLVEAHDPGRPAAALGGSAPIVRIFTSGTTGRPKAVDVPTGALAAIHAYQEFGLDVRPDDVFWNAADPGWAYGLYYGVLGPLCTGIPGTWLQGGFDPERTWAVLKRLGVTNLAAAPTVYRALRAAGLPPTALRLRRASSAGEPLTPDVNEWARDALGVLVHDHFGQTETGMIVNNHHHPALRRPVRPGSMGHAMPGWTAAILHADRDEEAPPGTLGRIAVDRAASPLAWFSGYVDAPDRTAEKFTADGRWYITGDSGRLDEDGYVHFLSRDDDVIIMAGYRIGPSDVESVLVTHPAVADAAVIAAPDDLRGEVLEAYVVLRDHTTGTPELAEGLQRLVKTRYAAHAYPRTVHFVTDLPRTASGKLQRHVLRRRRRAEGSPPSSTAGPRE